MTRPEAQDYLSGILESCGVTITDTWFESRSNWSEYNSFTCYFNPPEEPKATFSLRLLWPNLIDPEDLDPGEEVEEDDEIYPIVSLYAGINRTNYISESPIDDVTSETIAGWIREGAALMQWPYIEVITRNN